MHSEVVFVTGGARSGKSSFALQYAEKFANPVFLATAEPFDQEMRDRIEKHRIERRERFVTIEEPLCPERVLANLPSGTGAVLLDCLTVWAGNLMHHFGSTPGGIEGRVDALLDILRTPPCTIILVSNEVGMGIVPDNPMSRMFRDLAGGLNQRVAAVSSEAWLLCSGLPLRLK
ncbi:MAG: bifunctional adenosylcobinamide kinase/adenosylcobinamide-phosphate guanylyltransferase [Chlorobi bacterium]|nr:bifunctional adenosylcobinamide kinase/adenosylcobinamide-phosphate guanylyltransferase [Chlorobiota bacterium]